MRRWTLLGVSLLTAGYGAGLVLAGRAFDADPGREPGWCRGWLCGNEFLLPAARQQFWQGSPEQVPGATAAFREALGRDTASAWRWCDLGEALLESGDLEGARYCLERAVARGPNSPYVLLRAAHVDLRTGRNEQALAHMAGVLARVPDYDGVIFQSWERFGIPVEEALRRGVAQNRRPAEAFLRHQISRGDLEGAGKAWSWVASRGMADDRLAGEYVGFLLVKQMFYAARHNWANHLGGRQGSYRSGNPIYNGDFETEPTGCRLDWVLRGGGAVEVGLDDRVARSGRRSLRVHFRGTENVSFRGAGQSVVLEPGRYRLRAWVRTEGVTTNEGVRLRVVDAESPARLDVRTRAFVGTQEWEPAEALFLVTAATRLIEVQVVREPSWKFDNQIAGTAWVDGVELVREPGGGGRGGG